jgi:hypothetical protein
LTDTISADDKIVRDSDLFVAMLVHLEKDIIFFINCCTYKTDAAFPVSAKTDLAAIPG